MKRTGVALIPLAALFLSACARADIALRGGQPIQEPPGEEANENPWYILDSQQVPPVGQRCQLQGVSNDKQETSYWCWAATAQTVIKYLTNQTDIPRQCDIVSAVFADELTDKSTPTLKLDCCLVGDEYASPKAPAVKASSDVCIKTGWPERVFNTPNYTTKYSLIEYDMTSTDPQGLSWEEVVLQICDIPAGRPFIFTIRWWHGGGHTLIVEGYRQTADGSPFVEVHDPNRPDFPDFFVMPYEAYLGVPGDFLHDRDYINILK